MTTRAAIPTGTPRCRPCSSRAGRPITSTSSHIGEVTLADATAAQAAFANYTSTVAYPDSRLGGSLRLTASVLVADIGPRVFCVTQDGYDTHSSQLGDHEKLLLDLDQSLDAFYQDLVLHGHDQRVVVMTYSEFGRRVEDNGSGGTDHGTAAPLFVLGSRVKGGIYGAPPSLTDLDRRREPEVLDRLPAGLCIGSRQLDRRGSGRSPLRQLSDDRVPVRRSRDVAPRHGLPGRRPRGRPAAGKAAAQADGANHPTAARNWRSVSNDGRFLVEATWRTRDGNSGSAQAVGLTDEAGYFWFFEPNNIELVAKSLNGCSTDGHYWFFAAGLTNLEVTITVTNRATGEDQGVLESSRYAVRAHPGHGRIRGLRHRFRCSSRFPGTSSRREAPMARPSDSRRASPTGSFSAPPTSSTASRRFPGSESTAGRSPRL